jgi:hypothetical protein
MLTVSVLHYSCFTGDPVVQVCVILFLAFMFDMKYLYEFRSYTLLVKITLLQLILYIIECDDSVNTV